LSRAVGHGDRFLTGAALTETGAALTESYPPWAGGFANRRST